LDDPHQIFDNMNSSASLRQQDTVSSESSLMPDSILQAIEHGAHLLPAQGPITAFVHHNTLHAFEDLDFDTAVRKGGRVFGCHPYLPEKNYREMVTSGRIRNQDIEAVLIEHLGDRAEDLLGFLGTRFSLYRAILGHSLHDGPSVDLRWVIGDTNALNKFRDDAPDGIKKLFIEDTRQWVMRDLRNKNVITADQASPRIPESLQAKIRQLFSLFDIAKIESWSEGKWESFVLHLLWKICEEGAAQCGDEEESESIPKHLRHRDWLLDLTCEDSDELVHELLIPFCAAFLDQGFSNWQLADRDKGFFSAFVELYGSSTGLAKPWRRGLAAELQRHKFQEISPIESIRQSLDELGVHDSEMESFVGDTLLALRGFAGMLWQLESRGDRVNRAMPAGTLVEYLAIRLILDRLAIRHVAKVNTVFTDELSTLRPWVDSQIDRRHNNGTTQQQRNAFRLFELAQLLNWKPRSLAQNCPAEWKRIVSELNKFSGIERRQVYHLAYERKYRNETLDAVRAHSLRSRELPRRESPAVPEFQMVNCIDEREESFRRHLEEIYPSCETFGAAGFFAIPMYYRGAADAHFTPLCPVVIKPDHHVREEVVYSLRDDASKRKRARRTIGTVTHRVHIGSRTLTGGWLGTALLGSLATFPLVARILFPRMTAQLRGLMGGFVKPPEVTRLQLERDPQFPPGPSKEQLGFTVDEMASTVERLLRDIGLTKHFARIFFVCGHGSASLNNPHEAAHDCGACAGGRGGPNARAFAQMANDPRVRKLVAAQGLEIPEETIFVGCYHNTCDDSVTYYDLDQIPATHQAEFETADSAILEARKRDAHERCRRFESAPLDLSFGDALVHVEGRAEDLSQVRPEYGHATNALCFVGKRKWNRGLFLDRRAFLQSYDPQQDDENFAILERILQAVIPVCAGINLEYYFSFVDPVGYGCGTKLPHNITSLVGVMNGAGSDLRTGLPWQMVEIHEPVRLLFVIEATDEAMHKIISQNEAIKKLVDGKWVQLAILDAENSEIKHYRNGRFEIYKPETDELSKAPNSVDWYRGWRDHLKFASVGTEFGA
jgi:uncharacterized protein YbcC (UPF0753/DUF2309 family)